MTEQNTTTYDKVIEDMAGHLEQLCRGFLVLQLWQNEEVEDVYIKLSKILGDADAFETMLQVTTEAQKEAIEPLLTPKKKYIEQMRQLLANYYA